MSNNQTVSIQITPEGTPKTFTFSILIDGVLLNETHDVLEANWDFGDGTTVEDFEPTHTYTTTGNYDVQVDVIFGDGRGDGDGSGQSSNTSPPPVKSATTEIDVE